MQGRPNAAVAVPPLEGRYEAGSHRRRKSRSRIAFLQEPLSGLEFAKKMAMMRRFEHVYELSNAGNARQWNVCMTITPVGLTLQIVNEITSVFSELLMFTSA
jgi:hypothetical protein